MIEIKQNIPQMGDFLFHKLLEYKADIEGDLHISLSGGSTPKSIFLYFNEKYSQHPIWKEVQFWWGDERLVPLNSEDSNGGCAHRIFLKNLNIDSSQIHFVKGHLPMEEALKDYRQQMKVLPKDGMGLPYVHWLWLGLGEDGHCASIFPDFDDWESDESLILRANPYNGQWRTTFTPTMISRSTHTTFIVTGKAKSKVLSGILNDETSARGYPAYRIHQMLNHALWLCDKECSPILPDVPNQD